MDGLQQRGIAAELLVARDLVERGYYVFPKSLGAQGPIDLVAKDPEGGGIILLDVKSSRRTRARSAAQRELGVEIVIVDLDTRAIRYPPGVRESLRARLY